MDAYIDRDATVESLNAMKPFLRDRGQVQLLRRIMNHIGKIPVADVVHVVHGEWVNDGDGDWRCSSCRRLFTFDDYGDVHPLDDCWFNYCPTCGCRMDKDGDG